MSLSGVPDTNLLTTPMLRITSIRNRLILYFLAVIIPVMLVISLVLYNWLKHYYFDYEEEMLVRSGNMAAELVSGYIIDDMDQPRLISLAENISRQAQPATRVIFVDHNYEVVGDSMRIDSMIGDRLVRPEVETALEGENKRTVQYSEESEIWIMQVAVPVERELNGGESPVGAVFLSTSLEEVYEILGDVRLFLMWATLAAIVLVTAASFILARRFSEPLNELTVAAQKMAEGDLEQKIEISSEDEIGRLANQFNIMAERLDYMTRNLKAFAANVSHELRTPLTTLNLLIQSLRDHEMDRSQQIEFLDDLEQQTERLINMVTDLLEMTKLEHIKIKEKGKQFSLRNILLELVEQMSPWFEKANVKFNHDIPLALLTISGSPGQIRQVFYNLLDNALKYTPAGGEVKLEAWEEDEDIKVKVADTGKGVPESEREFIFERFYRIDQSRAKVEGEGGMGLGLAIAREIIEVHGGEITLESEEGKGSVFWITLPKEDISKDASEDVIEN